MKRDIEWAINEIEGLETESSQNYPHDEMIEKEIVLSILNQLDEPETLSFDWIDVNKKDSGVHYIGYYVPIGSLHDLLVPEQERLTIPNYVAKWISEHHDKFDLYPALRRLEEGSTRDYDAYKWYRKNTLKFVNAYLTGKYEVEEEQKYLVEDKNYALLCKWKSEDGWKVISTHESEQDDLPKEVLDFELTEQEIKDYDSRYFAFAVKI